MRAFAMAFTCVVALSAQTAPPLITSQDILAGLQDGTKWLTYSGNYFGHRHSPLTQITPENVGQLKSAWTFQTGALGNFQSTPLAIVSSPFLLRATGVRPRSRARCPCYKSAALPIRVHPCPICG